MEEEFKVPSLDIKRPVKIAQQKPQQEEKKQSETTDQEKPDPSQLAECPYVEPRWSGRPPDDSSYSFEVLKTGMIIEMVKDLENKPYWVFGRLPQCDIPMAHPTVSRFHAVLQYRPEDDNQPEDEEAKESETGDDLKKKKKVESGWYLYDLNSTHGTFVNKQRIPPKTYIRIRVGHIVKLGASTRQFILQGPTADEEEESELSVTELKELKKQQAIEMLRKQEEERLEQEKREKAREEEGVSWGMMDDAEDEEVDLSVNPYASTNNEQLFLDDPKKTLRGFFEREGLNLEYKCDEMSPGTFVCRVELPVDDAQGRPIVAEVCHKGKKKECVVQCALEACRILDRHGVLRQSHHEPLRRRVPKSDSDDDDDFLDRTGDVERRRQRKTNSGSTSALSYDDLLEQQRKIQSQLDEIEQKIENFKESEKAAKMTTQNEDEDLDDFMTNLRNEKLIDKAEIRKLRVEQQRLMVELTKVERLVKIATPHLPSIKSLATAPGPGEKKKLALPLFGKRTKLKNDFGVKREERKKPADNLPEEEVEEDEDEKQETKNEKSPEKLIKSAKEKEDLPKHEEASEKKLNTERLAEKSEEVPKEEPSSSVANKERQEKRILGPTIDPEILRKISEISKPEDNLVEHSEKRKLSTSNDQEADEEDKSESTTSKKRKTRSRNREKTRENIDMPDEDVEDDLEKFSGWLPPEDQKGDGMTELNKKLGY
ncbi:kanadaptin [Lutzomyia longipalpis]|uniref:kanadaptin n=1 Tax=Lutzomyia longipalpis TaxID=7200 RepID=UPI0024839AF9|nr:kanadaptin [Lutzomyia longipalpis]